MLVFCHLTWVRVISQFYSLFYYYFQHQYCVQSTGSGTTLNVEKTDDNYYSVLTVLFLFHFKYHCNLFFIFHFIILSGLLICSLFLLKEIFFFVYIFSDERDHKCECGQLETVEHVLKECPLHPAERDLLRKVSPELDPKILLDTKKGLGAVVKFLDSLPQLLC